MIWGKCDMKIGAKREFWQASLWFTLINQMNRQKETCSRNYKSRCNLLFVIKPFNFPLMSHFLTPLMKMYTSLGRHKKEGSGLD